MAQRRRPSRASVSVLGTAAFVAAVLLTTSPAPAGAAAGAAATAARGRPPVLLTALASGDSRPVRDMPLLPPQSASPVREGLPRHESALAPQASGVDSVRQTAAATVATPAVTSFEGTGNVDSVIPPDTDGAVGPNDYVELVNTHYQVFAKTGAPRTGPIESGQMWSAFSSSSTAASLCYSSAGGDGLVLYDRAADRWVFHELAFANGLFGPTGPYVGCFAVSQTGDPTGAYFVYAFLLSDSQLPDYPKLGIWGNSYYMSANMFTSVFASSGNPEVWAFDRSAMLAGPPANVQGVTFGGYVPSSYNTILPADVDGATAPPAGAPEIFAGLDFANNTTMGLWEFSQPDWSNPLAATFTGPTNIAVAAYSPLCNLSQDCLSQPGTTQRLDAISDRVMYRLAYRNFGDHDALAVVHSVNASSTGTQAGVRWYEFDRSLLNGQPVGGFSVGQQGTYAPDASTNRWMGSIAMDGAGDMALGYSAGSASVYPSMMFTGRLQGDPAGAMTVTEGTIQAGGGAQTGYNRWGDYTRMAVDPVDDCTFWYVGEYYSANSASQWQTRIGSFKLSGCTATPDFSLSVSPSSQTTLQGGTTAGYTLTINGTNGFASSVGLSVSGLPSDATASFVPNPATTTSTMTIATASTTPVGSYPLTITGTSGSLTHTATATLVVDPAGDFTLGADPTSQSVVQGSSTSYGITVNATGGFNGSVSLSATGLPSGATALFAPNPTTNTSTLSVATAPTTPAGTYAVTVTGTSGSLTHTVPITLVVTPTPQTVMSIVNMTAYGQLGTRKWVAWADVTVHDQNGNAVAGATVTFSFTGGTKATRTCTTDTSGYCSTANDVVSIPLSKHSETVTATKVAKSGATWDGVMWQATLTR